MASRKKQSLVREENNVSSIIFGGYKNTLKSTYKEAKKEQKKSKSRGGDSKNPEEKERRQQKAIRKDIENIRNELKFWIAYYGIGTPHIGLKNQPKMSKDQVLIMDIDFDGLYFTPDKTDLSNVYLKAKESSLNYEQNLHHKPQDYNLNNIPIWLEMKKFNSFRPMYYPICQCLAQINFPPEELSNLKLVDLLDCISHHNKKNPKHRMPSQRNVFLKTFAACYGQEFLEKMTLLGRKEEAQGLLTYIYYLDKPNQKMPKEAKEAAKLFNIHHVKNRKNAEEMEDYSQVNNLSNLTLCQEQYHKILHNPVEIDLNPNIVFFGSFVQDFQIIRNPEKERLYLQGKIADYRLKKEGR
ncbi:MAG: hypothetical protein IKW58_01700 [Alphaproteobacteria bacterium]|nr:hypothetical protein [Alphaproteobacteria bacterium]